MTDRSQFGASKPQSSTGKLDCATAELWLAEAAEDKLSPAATEQLREHIEVCPACRQQLADARRGREWLSILKQEQLEPPADLVFKILAKTVGTTPLILPAPGHQATDQTANDIEASPALSSPAWQQSSIVVLRRTLLEPRLALVAAMAFFSVTLTLNLMGVRLTNIHAADLAPQNLRRTVTRQYAEANARVARYYENLRIVYEVESRVQQLRRAAESAPQQQSSPKQKNSGSSDSSSDQKESHPGRMVATPDDGSRKRIVPVAPAPLYIGPVMDAAFRLVPSTLRAQFTMAGGRLASKGEPRSTNFLPFSSPGFTASYMHERRLA